MKVPTRPTFLTVYMTVSERLKTSVGDPGPVEVVTQNIFRVATHKKYPIANQIRPDRNFFVAINKLYIKIFWVATHFGRDPRKNSVAIQEKIRSRPELNDRV
jgi:hypothetical protein